MNLRPMTMPGQREIDQTWWLPQDDVRVMSQQYSRSIVPAKATYRLVQPVVSRIAITHADKPEPGTVALKRNRSIIQETDSQAFEHLGESTPVARTILAVVITEHGEDRPDFESLQESHQRVDSAAPGQVVSGQNRDVGPSVITSRDSLRRGVRSIPASR
jgi:hypothetical protein